MFTPAKAIELLIAAGVARVDRNNEQPFNPKVTLDRTIEARSAELVSHLERRERDLLEAANRYLERARQAEFSLKLANDREKIMTEIAAARERSLKLQTARLAAVLRWREHSWPEWFHPMTAAAVATLAVDQKNFEEPLP